MKKILSILFCVLFIFSALAVSVSASATDSAIAFDDTSVEEDLSTIYYNVNLVFPSNPLLEDLYLINLTEYGYDATEGVGKDYALYLYLYNPSGKFVTSGLNMVQFATSWKVDSRGNLVGSNYKKYSLTLLDENDDNTLLKFRVNDADEKIFLKTKDGKRRYDISGIELAHSNYEFEEYSVGYSYVFSGYMKGYSNGSIDKSTLYCQRDSFFTLELDVHQVSYLTGDSAKGPGYSNQINSVYFSIPADIEKKHGSLYDIKYEYYHYFLNPIVVTDNQESFDILLADRGKLVDSKSWPYAIYNAERSTSLSGIVDFEMKFSYGKQYKDIFLSRYYWYDSCKILDCLTTVFYKSDLEKDSEGLLLATAEELLQYMQDYNLSYHTGTVLNKYSADLFDLEKSKGYFCNTVNVDEVFSLSSYDDAYGNSLQRLLDYGFFYTGADHDVSIVDAKYIEEVTRSKLNASDFEKSMLMQEYYKDDLCAYYDAALLKGEKTYVLRYAFSDNYFSADLGSDDISGDFLMAEGNAYLNFDIIQMTFKNSDGVATVIPVSSAPSDGVFDVIDTTPNKDTFGEWWGEIWKVLRIILLVIGILILIFLCLNLIPPVNDFFRSLFKRDDKPKPTQDPPAHKKTRSVSQSNSSRTRNRSRTSSSAFKHKNNYRRKKK